MECAELCAGISQADSTCTERSVAIGTDGGLCWPSEPWLDISSFFLLPGVGNQLTVFGDLAVAACEAPPMHYLGMLVHGRTQPDLHLPKATL